jgi:hypothetical protein
LKLSFFVFKKCEGFWKPSPKVQNISTVFLLFLLQELNIFEVRTDVGTFFDTTHELSSYASRGPPKMKVNSNAALNGVKTNIGELFEPVIYAI